MTAKSTGSEPPAGGDDRRDKGSETESEATPTSNVLHGLRDVAPWRLALASGLALLLLAGSVLWFRCGLHGCPDVETLRGFMPDEASVVLDREGEEVSKLYLTRRVIVPLDSLPDHVAEAFVAIEDKRFWEHGGVDWRRVLGALAANVKSMGIEEGSSTITMQLARNVFPEKLPASQQTLWRKLGEARVAARIEREYSKHEILQLYLNQIYFGNGAYGIEAAAQEYFGGPAAELTLDEAAMLAALPRAPSRLNPRSNPEAALEGRALVLDRMVEQGWITEEEAAEADEVELDLRTGVRQEVGRAPYFVEAVRRQLEDALGDVIYTGGFTIHTTLDSEIQEVAEQELSQQMSAIESGRYGAFRHPTYEAVHADSAATLADGTPYLQSAFVMMDARTGDVLALIGGRDHDDSEFNRATQARRQPGSAFKPFVYATALGAGYPPSHRVADEPIRLVLDDGRTWAPQNYDGTYAGSVTLRDGLVHSKNVVTVRVAEEVGLGRVVGMAEQMLGQDVPANPSVVLGTAEVTPLQLTAAYAAFATLGRRPEPRLVTRVDDRNGTTIWSQQPYTTEVIPAAAAFLTTSLLQDVVTRGTGTAVRAVGFRGPAAGKTGTTQDAADIWFVGITPDVVGTVWIGFDKRETVLRGATGGELAAPVWGRVMREVAPESDGWAVPPGVIARNVNEYGEVIADNCPEAAARREYFLSGTAPVGTCYPDRYWLYDDSAGWIRYGDRDTLDAADDDGWWDRLRDRVQRWRDRSDSLRTDTAADTTANRSGRDSWPPVGPDSLRRDTVVRRPPPDTALPTPTDTMRGPSRDTMRGPVPDTMRIPADTTRRPPPDTTSPRANTTRQPR